MSHTFKPHLEILPPAQLRLWPELAATVDLGFVLYGDTVHTHVKVVLQRAEAKDYRDIIAMIRAGASLPHGLAAAKTIFGTNFQPSESLKALVYFEDGDLQTLAQAERQELVKAVSSVRQLPLVKLVSSRLA